MIYSTQVAAKSLTINSVQKWVVILFLFIAAQTSYAQNDLKLVKDINTKPSSFLPGEIGKLGSLTLFAMDDKDHGIELWSSDGTAAGTHIVADIFTGFGSSSPGNFAVLGNKVFFFANDGIHGRELWETDGTENGTKLSADIVEGVGSLNLNAIVSTPTRLFLFSSIANGVQIWVSDGTAAGTKAVDSYVESGFYFADAMAFGDKVIFSTFLGTNKGKVLITNGAAGGTSVVMPVTAVSFSNYYHYPTTFVEFKGKVYFHAIDSNGKYNLYSTDGTPTGTEIIHEGYISDFLVSDSYAYYGSYVSSLLYEYDGTGPESMTFISSLAELSFIDGSTLYFSAKDDNGVELWKMDLTTHNKVFVKDINPGSGDSNPKNFIKHNGIIYFRAVTENGEGLWKTDGTEAGTVLIKEIETASDYQSNLDLLDNPLNNLVFFASDSVNGSQPWTTDGTVAGTSILKKIDKGNSDAISTTIKLGSKLFFTANDGRHGGEIFVSDGTSDGTKIIKDVAPGIKDGVWDLLIKSSSAVFFQGFDGTNHNLYAVTENVTTTLVKENFSMFPVGSLGNLCVFSSSGHLWASDGTTTGTKDLGVGQALFYSDGYSFASTTNNLFFRGYDAINGEELWKSDGTPSGTTIVKDIAPGNASSGASGFVALGDRVIFTANDGTGPELWISDGTSEGTHLLKDIGDGPGSTPFALTTFNNHAFFQFYSKSNYELWETDGTETGTKKIRQLSLHPANSGFGRMISYHDKLFFMAEDASNGIELWYMNSKGEQQLFMDITSGVANSYIGLFSVVADKLFFRQSDSAGGNITYWVSDGTPTSTHALDFTPMVPSPYDDIENIGDLFIITGTGPFVGKELYSFTLDKVVTEVTEEQAGIKMFPNPCEQILHIAGLQNESVSVSVSDSFGKLVLHGFEKSFNDQASFNMNSLEAGLYFVKIKSANGEVTKKIVKK